MDRNYIASELVKAARSMVAKRLDYDDPKLQKKLDKATDENERLQRGWKGTSEDYEKARKKIWDKHLKGTGWTDDNIEKEMDKRF